MIFPVKATSLLMQCKWVRNFHSQKKVLHDRGLSTAVGDEGGFAPLSWRNRRRFRHYQKKCLRRDILLEMKS
jgi:enolase